MRRRKVMLIPDSMGWVLGTWAAEIKRWNRDLYDFLIVPMAEIAEDEDFFLKLASASDVVHCLTQSGFPRVNRVLKRLKRRDFILISSVLHITGFADIEENLEADRIMVMCRLIRQRLESREELREKLFMHYIGVDTDFYTPMDRSRARTKLGIPRDLPAIGFSCKMASDHDNRKGIDILLQVIERLSSGPAEPFGIVISGPGWEEKVDDLWSRGCPVYYFPYLEPGLMPCFYNALDVFLVTSREEGGPVTLFEAMSCGVPVVTTPVGMAVEFIHSGRNGIVVSGEDAAGTAAALHSVFRDPAQAGIMATAGRRTVVEKLQWRATVAMVRPVYGGAEEIAEKPAVTTARRLKPGLDRLLIRRDQRRWRKQFRSLNRWEVAFKKLLLPLTKRVKKIQNRCILYLYKR